MNSYKHKFNLIILKELAYIYPAIEIGVGVTDLVQSWLCQSYMDKPHLCPQSVG